MTDHEVYRDLISAYVDGELTDAERAEVQYHAATCRECADLLREYEDISSLFAADEKVPAGFSRRVMAGVRAVKAERRRKMLKRIIPAAACLVLVVGAVSILPNLFGANKSAESSVMMMAAPNAKYTDQATESPSMEERKSFDANEAVSDDAGETGAAFAPAEECEEECAAVEETESLASAAEKEYDFAAYGDYPAYIAIAGLKREFLTHEYPEGLPMPEGIEKIKFTPAADGGYTAEMPLAWYGAVAEFARSYGTDCAELPDSGIAGDIMLVILEP